MVALVQLIMKFLNSQQNKNNKPMEAPTTFSYKTKTSKTKKNIRKDNEFLLQEKEQQKRITLERKAERLAKVQSGSINVFHASTLPVDSAAITKMWAFSRLIMAKESLTYDNQYIVESVQSALEKIIDTPVVQFETHFFTNALSEVLQAFKNASATVWQNLPTFLGGLLQKFQVFANKALEYYRKLVDTAIALTNTFFDMYVILFVLLLRSFGLRKLSSIVVDFWLIMSHNNVISLLGLSSLIYDVNNYFQAGLPSVQSEDTNKSLILGMFIAAASVFGYGTSNLTTEGYHQFARAMMDHRNIILGATTVGSSLMALFEFGMKWFGLNYFGLNEEGEMPEDIVSFKDAISSFTLEKRQSIAMDLTVAREAHGLMDTYLALSTKYSSNRILKPILDKYQGVCANLQIMAQSNSSLNIKNRVEPVVLMLRGESGTGKSTLMYHIGVNVLAFAGAITGNMEDEQIDEAIRTCVYPRVAENVYWEGYKHTPVTLVDDAFQMVDSLSNPNLDYMELIRMSNSFPYPLHMASIAGKTNNNFSSKAVIYTTNLKTLKPASLISQEAVTRRVTMPYEVRIKDEFAENGRLASRFLGNGIRTDVYSFHKWNPKTGHVSTTGIGFEDLMNVFKQKLAAKQRDFELNTTTLRGYARHIMANVQMEVEEFADIDPQGLNAEQLREAANQIYGAPLPRQAHGMGEVPLEEFQRHDGRYLEEHPGPVLDEFHLNSLVSDTDWVGNESNRFLNRFSYFRRVVPENLKNAINLNINLAIAATEDEDVIHLPQYSAEDYFIYWVALRRGWETRESIIEHVPDLIQEYCQAYASFISGSSEFDNLIRRIKVFFSNAYDSIRPQHIWIGYLALLAVATIYSMVSARSEERIEIDKNKLDRSFPKWDELNEMVDRINAGENPTAKDVALCNEYMDYVENNNVVEDIRIMRVVKSVVESGKARRRNGAAMKNKAKTEAWGNQNAEDICKLVGKNQVLLRVYKNGQPSSSPAYGLFLGGTYMVLNTHYVRSFNRFLLDDKDLYIEILNLINKDAEGIKLRWSEMRENSEPYLIDGQETDLTILQVNGISRYPDITSHLIRSEDLKRLKGKRITMTIPNGTMYTLKCGNVIQTIDSQYNDEVGKVRTSSSVVTNISSQPGECGAVYVLDESDRRKIVGVHFAGINGQALAVPLCGDLLPKMDGFKFYGDISPVVNGNITFLGEAQLDGKPYRMFSSTDSKLMKTKMFDQCYESPNSPAVLDSRWHGDIMKKAIRKQTRTVELINEDLLDQAGKCYLDMLPPSKEKFVVLSFEEAVSGVPDRESIGGVSRSTSAGFPYSQRTSKKGKTEWFGEDEWTLTSPKCLEFKEDVEEKISAMKKGEPQMFVFTDTLKDETRPKEKRGKTRLFAAAPMDFIVIFRMYFMSFLAYMMENRIMNESAVGIKAQTMEWCLLAKRLNIFKNVIAGDFSDYDGTLHPKILWKVYEIIESFYANDDSFQEGDDKVRKELWHNIVCSTHINGNILYNLNHSQPSGNPATAILNSMYNSIACRYTFYKRCSHNFNEEVVMIAYGDDNVLSISDTVKDKFNQETMSEDFAEIGMTYTDEEKKGNLGFKNLGEVYFLKRKFRLDGGIYYGPLKLDSILDCFNWIHSTKDELGVISGNFIMANIELAMHEEETFNFWIRKLRSIIQNVYGKNLSVVDRDNILNYVRDGCVAEHFDCQWI